MSFTLTSSGAIVQKAGSGVNSTAAASSALLAAFSDQAEGTISAATRYDWVTNYGTLDTDIKQTLSDGVSDLAAMKLVAYDMSGYVAKREAETLLDLMRDNSVRIIEFLRNKVIDL